ncbi:LysM peptidoglycan-binding domain-containing protein, partial [Vagococcus sp. DIV0080]
MKKKLVTSLLASTLILQIMVSSGISVKARESLTNDKVEEKDKQPLSELPESPAVSSKKEGFSVMIEETTDTSSFVAETNQLTETPKAPITIDDNLETSDSKNQSDNQNQTESSTPSEPTTDTSSSNQLEDNDKSLSPSDSQETSVRRKRGQLEEAALSIPKNDTSTTETADSSVPESDKSITENSFNEKEYDQAVEKYIDNANEEELQFLSEAQTEEEMKEALEYLLLSQIEEEYGVESLAELKKYLNAKEIEQLDNEQDIAKFEEQLTKLFNQREKQNEVEALIDELVLMSTDEEIEKIQHASEGELKEVLLQLSEAKTAQLETESKDRDKRFAPVLAWWAATNTGTILTAAGNTIIVGGVLSLGGIGAQKAKQRSQERSRARAAEQARAARAARIRNQMVARAAAQAAQRARNYVMAQARAQALAKARAQTAAIARQQAAARARAQAAANARRQSAARPYITTKPVRKPVVKARPVTQSKPKTKPVAKPQTKPVSKLKTKTPAASKPAVKPVTKPSGLNTYKVRAGDSVWGIAEQYGLSVAKFIEWNSIKNNTLHPGQAVHLKDPKANTSKSESKPATKPATKAVDSNMYKVR